MRRDVELQLELEQRSGRVGVSVNLGKVGLWFASLFDRRKPYRPREFASQRPEQRRKA